MGVMEAKAMQELARAFSIWQHAGGNIGLVLGMGLGWVEVWDFWNLRLGWGREGLVPISQTYWYLNLVM